LILLIPLVAISLGYFFYWQNNAIVVTNYTVKSEKLPKDFQGYKIVQVSDLHNKDFDWRLTNTIKPLEPNLIVLTGDLIDRRTTQVEQALEQVQQLVHLAPVVYVSGNHEQLSPEFALLKAGLTDLGVTLLDQKIKILTIHDSQISLLGLADPAMNQGEGDYLWEDNETYAKEALSQLKTQLTTDFNILLSHRPELFSVYRDLGIDLVFSGHAHGGQVRLPFIGGLVAPNQGFFPKLTNGIHESNGTQLIISRGLGNSVIPLRIFNRPEVVCVTLSQ
jgi:uncharacterized protein